VGVTRFASETPSTVLGSASTSTEAENDQLARLAAVKQQRDDEIVRTALVHLRDAAERGDNTIPMLLEAVRAYATVGEICDVLASIWGRYRDQHRSTH
jgi:methylmalonyl-CoA mutase N-terminal domain/subunit